MVVPAMLGYLLCIPVAIASYAIGTLKDAGKVALLERKLSESHADREMLIGKYDGLNASCTAITSNSHAVENELADLKIAYHKLFDECEVYKRQVTKTRLEPKPPTRAKKSRVN